MYKLCLFLKIKLKEKSFQSYCADTPATHSVLGSRAPSSDPSVKKCKSQPEKSPYS